MDRAAGIRVGEGKIQIRPMPDRRVGYVKAAYDSPLGEIRSSWEYLDALFRLEVEVPPNVEAEVIMPDGTRHEADAGIHVYEIAGESAD